MFAFLRKMASGAVFPDTQPSMPSPVNGQKSFFLEHEMVRLVLRQITRQHGIPADWLGCDGVAKKDGQTDESCSISIVITRWDEKLIAYIPALQQRILQGLDLFDPKVDHSGFEVTWKFALISGTSVKNLPKNTDFGALSEGVRVSAFAPILDQGVIRAPGAGEPKIFLSDEGYKKMDFADTNVLL